MFKLLSQIILISVNYILFIQSYNLTNEWVVRINGGPEMAKTLAFELGYQYRGPVRGFLNTYLLTKLDIVEQHKRSYHYLTKQLNDDFRVVWADQQYNKEREKRDLILINYSNLNNSSWFNDELWPQQWYLQNYKKTLSKLDLNVLPVYELGITGRGVRISVLDDGLEHTHDDLRNNYDPSISWDCNQDDPDPLPKYDSTHRNAHGTKCAGEIAMIANNWKCGVGVAYNAKIGGIKLLDGLINDRVEGMALGFGYELIDIYSASWGPRDDGRTLDGPGRLALEAFERGVTKGRNGKGSIFVWASGNGGHNGDNCNCDGYAASPYTITIGSASQTGSFPWYGEICASTMAVTYSSGSRQDQKIVTTDLNNKCTIKHTGTSASAPLAAGIIALVLEANSNLTWRDVQHLIVWTSNYKSLLDNNLGWKQNGIGLWINTRFGFGLLDAYRLVLAARQWFNVPSKQICSIKNKDYYNKKFRTGQLVVIEFDTNVCLKSNKEINYLEHVELTTNIEYTRRGQLEMYLISAQGTQVQVLAPRIKDSTNEGFRNWTFLSVLMWGENPHGLWILKILDKSLNGQNNGRLGTFNLILHGTKDKPIHMQK